MTAAAAPLPTHRPALLQRLAEPGPYDVVVIGGGATGLGVALDAATRGLKTLLLEAHDFAKGTSSRATKLVHGGVRYLAQGNVALVREALRERAHILTAAPHLAQPLAFVMPAYQWWEKPWYGLGLKAYDLLAGRQSLGRTELLDASATLARLPGAQPQGLKGGVQYWDGQFDDARLALALARTAARHGALLVNYCRVTSLHHADGRVAGVQAQDVETGRTFEIEAACVINATGVWVDALRQQDAALAQQTARTLVAPSQGVHVVVDGDFLPGPHALLVPSTADGRVLFAVPWLGKLILGTTDSSRQDLPLEPQAREDEVDFILREAARYLRRAPTRADVRSQWAGLRPLVKPQGEGATKTISREHTIEISGSRLVTVTGGKWTTYRSMAADVLAQCADAGLLPRGSSQTVGLPLVGAPAERGAAFVPLCDQPGLHLYGSEGGLVEELAGAQRWLAPGLSEAMVRFAARYEYARTVEDVLARRSRLLFLDAAAAVAAAPAVAQVLESETAAPAHLQEFVTLAPRYQAQKDVQAA